MRFVVLVFFLGFSLLFAKSEVETKIKKTSSQLSSYKKNYKDINKKLSQTARAIIKQKKELEKQNRYLKKLKAELAAKELVYKESKSQLQLLKKSQTTLLTQQQQIEEELVFVISKSVSLSVVLDEAYAQNEESLIEMEVLKSMLKAQKAKAKQLSQKFFATKQDITLLDTHAKTLQNAINAIDAKRKKLLKTQRANKRALKKLQLAKASYTKKLKNLIRKQNALKETLSHLNIIKIDEEKKKAEAKAQKEAFQKKKIALDTNLPKVKKHGSSYQRAKTIRYRGRKTIAPLNHYTITKNYGTYTDPIYGIKIFNESISLKPKRENAKVKTVFNGKVIYADKTAVLNNIVIVEHKNGLHTIYANLSQIAPNIKKGRKIKKGATIGRVKNELIFEVTQKSYHINPIQLFR